MYSKPTTSPYRFVFRRISKLLIVAVAMMVFVRCNSAQQQKETPLATSDSVEVKYSFVVMGCNRISWHDDDAAWKNSKYYNEAHTNLNQLMATFDDAMKLNPLPDYFFFVGDLVLAESQDTSKLVNQLKAWKKLYYEHAISKSKIKMVAVPGNHEFLYSTPPDYKEVPNEYANEIWLRLMSDFIVGNNGPGIGGPDSLLKDESQLTYSFDHRDDHFVLMNTDTYNEPGKVPVDWITNDINTWRAGHKEGHIFLMGHKPAYDAKGLATGDSKDPGLAWNREQVNLLWSAMNKNRSEAMLSAHEHLFWAGQPAGSASWQIIAGNGGTTLDSGDYFGFTEVKVMTDGTVKAYSHGRPVPSPDYGAPTGSTTVRDTFDITWSQNSK
ncbi:metallophosphoesterase [Fulvivirga sp. 29W222]|uniref:Metallophosphoesterase n=1 Tax=Fulvivirga marina TaxID=2494733 RepID=A0A937FVZ3_9BACT|nr:metallophosphoesterase [Fulvivirga marina]MBL6445987.1 metallophosphoesterase [Fulvivirga marina]